MKFRKNNAKNADILKMKLNLQNYLKIEYKPQISEKWNGILENSKNVAKTAKYRKSEIKSAKLCKNVAKLRNYTENQTQIN